MASEKKVVKKSVKELISEMKEKPSKRFSYADYQALVYAVLSDADFKAKKYLLENDAYVDHEYSIRDGMNKFLDKVLKHAGLSSETERSAILETFEFGAKDVDWVCDCVDEAMLLYVESGKNMRMFRDKMLQLSIQKIVRTGKYAGQVTYKKLVADKAAALAKKQKKSA